MARSKIVINGETYIDLTADTVVEADVASGKTFHKADGTVGTGTNTYDSDTSDDTALIAEVLDGKTFHARGTALEGTMPNNGAVSGTIATKNGVYTVPQGYHDGSGTVQLATAEKNKLIPANIKAGITILSVEGDYSGEGATAEAKTVTPTFSQQVITPTSADYLSQVTVNAIPVTEVVNASGGTTVTVG